MDCREFERLCLSDPVVFHLGLDLFMQNGRDRIARSTDQELYTAAAVKLAGFFAENRIRDAAEAAKGFAGLESMELLACAARCGVKLEEDPADMPGVCPLCGGSLRYGEDVSAHRPHAASWTCDSCGATGKEAYREVFDCHYDLRDAGGRPADRKDQKRT